MLGLKILWLDKNTISSIGWLPGPIVYYEINPDGLLMKIMANGGESAIKLDASEANIKEIERLQNLTAPYPAAAITGNPPADEYWITAVIINESNDNGGYLVNIEDVILPDNEAAKYAQLAKETGIHRLNQTAIELLDEKFETEDE